MSLAIKDRIAELSKLISVAQREAAKARERGANDIAESYGGAGDRWRAERERLLSQREQTTAHPDENGVNSLRLP